MHPSKLEGFEFADILLSQNQIKPKELTLDPNTAPWLSMVKENEIINIFGSGFGDLIVPTRNPTVQGHPSCSQQMQVPEGFNYLAAPLYVLRELAEKCSDREDGSVALSDSSYWVKPDVCLSKCLCASKKVGKCLPSLAALQGEGLPVLHLGAMLESLGRKRKSCPSTDVFKCHPNGAVIFGHDTKTAARRNRKRKQQFAEGTGRNTRSRGSDSGVDLGLSSSSGNASSPSHSQPSVGDSGVSDEHSI
jgi:hypothetical protein